MKAPLRTLVLVVFLLAIPVACGKRQSAEPKTPDPSAQESPKRARPGSITVQGDVNVANTVSTASTANTTSASVETTLRVEPGRTTVENRSENLKITVAESAPGVAIDAGAPVQVISSPVIRIHDIVPVPRPSPDQLVRLDSKPGSKVRIEGTSSLHNWQVEGKLIGGYAEVGPGFPLTPGAPAPNGPVYADISTFIPVRSLVSLKADGSPYSTMMDDIMYDKLQAAAHPRITYRLRLLAGGGQEPAPQGAYGLAALGDLIVAGATNSLPMQVEVLPFPDGRVKISGAVSVLMTQFGITPPEPPVFGTSTLIKTGDRVTLRFEWMVGQRAVTARAAK